MKEVHKGLLLPALYSFSCLGKEGMHHTLWLISGASDMKGCHTTNGVQDVAVHGHKQLHSHPHSRRQFPEIFGALNCRGGQLHFWDSPDDVRDVDMQMVGALMYVSW